MFTGVKRAFYRSRAAQFAVSTLMAGVAGTSMIYLVDRNPADVNSLRQTCASDAVAKQVSVHHGIAVNEQELAACVDEGVAARNRKLQHIWGESAVGGFGAATGIGLGMLFTGSFRRRDDEPGQGPDLALTR